MPFGGSAAAERGDMNRLKLIAVGYLVKTILFGIAWLMVPDLPQRAMTKARQTWDLMAGRP